MPKKNARKGSAVAQPETPALDRSQCEEVGSFKYHDGSEETLVLNERVNLFYLESTNAPAHRVTLPRAFHWWHKCQLLHEHAGDYTGAEGAPEFFRQLEHALFRVEEDIETKTKQEQDLAVGQLKRLAERKKA